MNPSRAWRSRSRAIVLGTLILISVVASLSYAHAQVGGGFDLSWSTVDGGGATFSTGGAYELGGTIGQADAGTVSGGAYTLDGGFWGASVGDPTGTPTSTSTRTSTPLPTQTPGGPTATPVPPSNTPTDTPTSAPTNTPTHTNTPLPTQTPGGPTATPIPTDTALPTNTPQSGLTPTALPTACLIQFSDVPEGSTFYDNIRCLACRGVVSGYPDGTFKPNNNVTRGQLSKIVSNAAEFSDPAGSQIFEDVQPGSTFFDFVQRLASRGIIGGYACGGLGEPCIAPNNLPYFRTNNNATRGQISKIVSNAARFTDPAGSQIFEDVSPGSTFFDFIQRLASRGYMNGYACGGPGEPCISPGNRPYFRPSNNATRGQTSKIVGNTFYPNCQTPSRLKN